MRALSENLQMPPADLSLIKLALLPVIAIDLALRVVAVLRHPLRHIPGPLSAKLGFNHVLALHNIKGSRTTYIHSLHEKYGPVVRVGPEELSVNDLDTVKAMYANLAAFPKDMKMYGPMQFDHTHPGLFNMNNKDQHSRRRCLISPAFARQNILDTEDHVTHKIRRVMDQFTRQAKIDDPNGINLLIQWRLFTGDVIARTVFGADLQMVESDQLHPFIKAVDAALMLSIIGATFGPLFLAVKWVCSNLLPKSSAIRQVFDSQHRAFNELATNMVNDYAVKVGHDATSKEVVSRLLGGLKTGDSVRDMGDVLNESINLMTAGIDTTSTTITYACWRTFTTPRVYKAAHEEIVSVFPSVETPPSFQTLEKLSVLNSIIRETFRLHSAAPSTLARVCRDGMVVRGIYVPPGTTVGSQSHSIHRVPEIWGDDADEWKPERWADATKQQEQALRPFSTGPADCVGQSLAWLELYVALAWMFRFFKGELAEGFTDSDMDPTDFFLLVPKSNACRMKLTPVA